MDITVTYDTPNATIGKMVWLRIVLLKFVRHLNEMLMAILIRFFRFLGRCSIFVHEHKLSNMVPVAKSGISAYCSNYRPIAIPPLLSKVAEKLIFKTLYKYVESKGLITDSHYVYREQYLLHIHIGTCDALLDLTCHLQKNLDGFVCRVIQIGFSATFDLVNHKALIYETGNLGVDGNV
ncbi:uncharacterized protein [Macrobrachium rosenbergii]|uniref:uncharacterized protein n=1 Tax=Macrobrachium rosenbergii TaxID=79674 RepID=UPI0034D582EB